MENCLLSYESPLITPTKTSPNDFLDTFCFEAGFGALADVFLFKRGELVGNATVGVGRVNDGFVHNAVAEEFQYTDEILHQVFLAHVAERFDHDQLKIEARKLELLAVAPDFEQPDPCWRLESCTLFTCRLIFVLFISRFLERRI